MQSTGANQLAKQSPIDRMLDVLTERISTLETTLDRVWMKTDPVRCSLPSCPSDCDREEPSMSPVASRISASCRRLATLNETVERLISEIEL